MRRFRTISKQFRNNAKYHLFPRIVIISFKFQVTNNENSINSLQIVPDFMMFFVMTAPYCSMSVSINVIARCRPSITVDSVPITVRSCDHRRLSPLEMGRAYDCENVPGTCHSGKISTNQNSFQSDITVAVCRHVS